MSEFKITYKTTLYDLQEFCKDMTCNNCNLNNNHYCTFRVDSPDDWNISKPKTYKEDFLEKFPNAVINDCDTLAACRALIYDGAVYCTNRELNCDKCWNEIMEE